MADDWWFIRDRSFGGVDTLLEPFNEHIVILQAAAYRIFFELFGIESAVPLQILSLGAFLGSILALFVYLRQQVGEPAAALAAVPVLFMGTAYHDLLWTFQIGYSLSILGGLIALISLGRDGKSSRPIGCAGPAVSVTSSSLGLPFIVGVGVLLIYREGRVFWRNYAWLVPALIYSAWYLLEGREAQNYVSFENALGIPLYVLESLKSVTMGLTGIHALPAPWDGVLGIAVTAFLICRDGSLSAAARIDAFAFEGGPGDRTHLPGSDRPEPTPARSGGLPT